MTGKLGDKVNEIAKKFNASQSDYKVTPVYKGQYDESMAAAIAAYRAGNPPQIVQVFEVGTATMMAAKGAIKPVYQLMAESGEKFDPKAYIPARLTATTPTRRAACCRCRSTARRRSSTINEDAFKKAGLDPAKPPKTWPEVGRPPGSSRRRRRRARSPPAGSRGSSSRASAPGTTCRSRPSRTASAASTRGSSSTGRCRSSTSRRCATGRRRAVHLRRPQGRAAVEVHSGDCAMITTSSGLREHQGQRQVQLARRAAAVLRRRQGRAAEHDHRRRDAVGADARRIRRSTRASPSSSRSFVAGDPGRLAPVDRLRPDHDRGLRAHQEPGLLREESGSRHRDRRAQQQAADGELEGRAPRQLRRDPQHQRRGAGAGLERQEDREAGARRRGAARQRAAREVRKAARSELDTAGEHRGAAPRPIAAGRLPPIG